jgi:hypothetical protein
MRTKEQTGRRTDMTKLKGPSRAAKRLLLVRETSGNYCEDPVENICSNTLCGQDLPLLNASVKSVCMKSLLYSRYDVNCFLKIIPTYTCISLTHIYAWKTRIFSAGVGWVQNFAWKHRLKPFKNTVFELWVCTLKHKFNYSASVSTASVLDIQICVL